MAKAMNRKAQDWLRHTPTVKLRIPKDSSYGTSSVKIPIKCYSILANCRIIIRSRTTKTDIYDKLNKSYLIRILYILIRFTSIYIKEKNVLSTENEHKILSFLNKYQSSTIPYREHLPNIRFVDTIGMVCPFLNLCEKEI